MYQIDQESLIDPNMYKKIERCYINETGKVTNRIFVIYEDGSREYIWTYDRRKFSFDHKTLIGKDKLEALFYCSLKVNSRKKDANTYFDY